jgi:hypothetical protein
LGGFITAFGGVGYDDGQFIDNVGIANDPFGNIYVADMINIRIQKFKPVQ